MAKLSRGEQAVISKHAAFNTPLDEHIGRTVRFKNPTCLAEREEYKVRHIQTDWQGKLCFNLIGVTSDHMGADWIGSFNHQFGRPASFYDVYFTDEVNN